MRTLGLSAMLVAIWLVFALAIDRLFLSYWCPQCANVLALELKLTMPAATLTYPPVSLIVLLLLPMIALAVFVAPWNELRSAAAWRQAFEKWAMPWLWLCFAVVLCIVGESLYLVTKEYLPKAITTLAEKFSITGTVSVAVKGFKETTPVALTASFSGLIGLTLGAYLFLEKGVNEIFKFPKA